MNAEYKRIYRQNMPRFQKAKYNEYRRNEYDNLTPEQKAALLERRKVYYQANKERIRLRQLEYYHAKKDK